jgi:hypothetical protein
MKPPKANTSGKNPAVVDGGETVRRADRRTKTFLLCCCTRRMVAMSIDLAPQPGRILRPGHSNGVRFLLSWRIGTPIILARPRTAMTVRLSWCAIIMMLFPAPAICRSCASSSSFQGRSLTKIISLRVLTFPRGSLWHARPHGRLRPPTTFSRAAPCSSDF